MNLFSKRFCDGKNPSILRNNSGQYRSYATIKFQGVFCSFEHIRVHLNKINTYAAFFKKKETL